MATPLPNAQPQIADGIDSQDGLPRRFGKYTLIRKLATGGMAELFLAIQKSMAGFEKLIVIKRILPAMNQDRAFIEMLLHEARIAATLSHANIAQTFDVGLVDGTYYIAMEHVHGEDLRAIVRQMREKGVREFPLEHAISIILAICGGLSYAHEKRALDGSSLNIVHRDISPQNVVVTFEGDIKIVDFGIAKSDTQLGVDTSSGKLKGKVPYMSPEQARGEEIDSRSDLFAVGIILFELTTGKRLFKRQGDFETLKLICEREYPRPSRIREGYPEELERIVMRALEKDKDARFQSGREMQAALEDFVRHERIPVSNIALTRFMQSLFEEKLASHKKDLIEGKQLADLIELRRQSDEPPGRESEPGATRSALGVLSTPPAAARTVTDVNAASRKNSNGIIAALAIAATLGASGVAYWQHKQKVASVVEMPPAGTASRGTISVTSDPPGATIWIDGEMRTEVTPATIAHLPTGRAIDVKVTKEGFEIAKQTVTLADTDPSATLILALPKGLVTVDVVVNPPGLNVTILLDGQTAKTALDNTSPERTSLLIEGVSAGDLHKLVVSAPGYLDQAVQFTGEPQEQKRIDVAMQKDAHHRWPGAPAPTRR
jgi:serine/threonine-protein kinase